MLEEIRKMKTHAGVAFSMFSDVNNINQYPVVQAIVKGLGLERQTKSKYNSVRNLNLLTKFIMRSSLGTARDLMRRTMGLIVAFLATRMVELARITRNDITFRDEIMIIKTAVKKYKKPKQYEITFNKRQIPC
ncbi:MAG: hypothetical protein EZS28_016682 [Streblomastix strix]|uniref:Tyr recombinase domain-containing protein n=1 Tax=Streblomastix strix TaxID=222440 RepID=A0A5J4VZW6_9EUKA|nr:MAG: hypothetical protein EZS28_016682 [Streblomastix strix]